MKDNMEKVALELQKNVKDTLNNEAKEKDMSLSALIRVILKDYVNKKN